MAQPVSNDVLTVAALEAMLDAVNPPRPLQQAIEATKSAGSVELKASKQSSGSP